MQRYSVKSILRIILKAMACLRRKEEEVEGKSITLELSGLVIGKVLFFV
jgi:hypothetical protein